jgi:hypothetical protein
MAPIRRIGGGKFKVFQAFALPVTTLGGIFDRPVGPG